LLTEGHFIIISPKVPHSTKCIQGNKAILIQLPSDFLTSYLPNYENLYFQSPETDNSGFASDSSLKLQKLILAMAELKHQNSTSSQVLFQSKLFEFLYVLLEDFTIPISPETQKQRSKNLLRLESSIQYIQENYSKAISLKEIAKVATLQPEYFCRLFKKTMGVTYLTYINELRLSYIYRDLLLTDFPLVKLLETYGFSNYKLFRRMFFEHFQMTPGKLRKSRSI
ncbi:MAG: helix-turn-helix transcriptional regulator, partial [Vallitaleaceae bacterium]|nr:helix-turn-helix transcriptional regulator [Vallitaleaceae bacterium]